MFNPLTLLCRPDRTSPRPTVPRGQRVYAIGDIHGMNSLFTKLIAAIEADDARRGAAETTIVLLGDLIDRGPDSAGVVDRARDWARHRRIHILRGNHEEMLLRALTDPLARAQFLRAGGKETLFSYGVSPKLYSRADPGMIGEMMARAIPPEHVDLFAQSPDSLVLGDYLFVHAGIRPGVPLHAQQGSDLRWIREPFLSHRDAHEKLVVHGHTIAERPQVRANRIGIDTGAYRHGRLTALGLEGTAQWLIEASDASVARTIMTPSPRAA